MTKIHTEVDVGTVMFPAKNVTLPRSIFSDNEQAEIKPGPYVVLQTEYGPWRFLMTYSSESVCSFESYRAPGEDV